MHWVELDETYRQHIAFFCRKLDKRSFFAFLYGNYKSEQWYNDASDMMLMGGEL